MGNEAPAKNGNGNIGVATLTASEYYGKSFDLGKRRILEAARKLSDVGMLPPLERVDVLMGIVNDCQNGAAHLQQSAATLAQVAASKVTSDK